MELEKARIIAIKLITLLSPHCERIEIAGSIRRNKPFVGDIELVAIPKPYETGLFASGIVTVLDRYEITKGHFPCKYTQRILPEGIKLDFFTTTAESWGYTYAVRTGSADYSHKTLAVAWVSKGYRGMGGHLCHNNIPVVIREEIDLYKRLGLKWVDPEFRDV